MNDFLTLPPHGKSENPRFVLVSLHLNSCHGFESVPSLTGLAEDLTSWWAIVLWPLCLLPHRWLSCRYITPAPTYSKPHSVSQLFRCSSWHRKKKRFLYKTLAMPVYLLNYLFSPRCRYARQHSLVTQPLGIQLFSPSWRNPPSRLGFQKRNMES